MVSEHTQDIRMERVSEVLHNVHVVVGVFITVAGKHLNLCEIFSLVEYNCAPATISYNNYMIPC